MKDEDDALMNAYDLGLSAATTMLEFLAKSTNGGTDGRDAEGVFQGAMEAMFYVLYRTNPDYKEADDLIANSASNAKAMLEQNRGPDVSI